MYTTLEEKTAASEKAKEYRERAVRSADTNDPDWLREKADFFEQQEKELEELFAQYTK